MFDYSNQNYDLVNTGQYQSNLTDAFLNFFGQNSAQQQNNFNAQQASILRQFNSAEAQKQRDFEERMASTQYQRAVADLKAAGLNTALAYSQGGASVPSGAVASGGSAAHASSGSVSGLFSGIVNSLASVAKAAIQANSADKLAKLSTIVDVQKVGDGRTRTTTWRE